MSIKGRIRAFQVVVALTLTAMAALALVNLQESNRNLGRLKYAQRQLAAAAQLAIDANRFSEQIAELLLIGEPERPDFEGARAQLRRALEDLREITRQEDAAVHDETERAEERTEFDRIDRMEALLRRIDRAVERLLLLDQQGRRDEAVALFRSEIENRLDAEFESLIAAAVADERAETLAVEADVARLAGWVTAATLAGVVALVAATLVAGFLFARSIARPIRALAGGAHAIERGELGHRIGDLGQDEFGLLAKRFDAMADEQKAVLRHASEASSADMSWKLQDRYSRDLLAMSQTQGVNVRPTPRPILDAQLQAWDRVIARQEGDASNPSAGPFFKKVCDSQREWCRRVGNFMLRYNVSPVVSYNHFFART